MGDTDEGLRTAQRQARLALARRFGALPVLERVAFWRERRAQRAANAAFAGHHPDTPMPPLRWMHDMYAHANYDHYWRTGRNDADKIGDLIGRHLGDGRHVVAEWGCGMGRVVRHLADSHYIHGFDYNPAAIAWCDRHLVGTFARNRLNPPLPRADDSLDAVFAISVLTHLSEAAHEDWLEELARVIRPGGIALLTVHGAPAPGQLLPTEQARFDAGRVVTRGRVKEGSRIYAAYQPEPFMRGLFERHGMTVLADPTPAFGQTLWVVRV